MKIKICGLTNPLEAEYLNKNKVDFAGMVLFFPKSKRNIDLAQAKTIIKSLGPSVKKVAVVVSPSVEQAVEICHAGFDIIQIHGQLADEVYEAVDIDIWKAFNVKDMDQYQSFAEMEKIKGFVFDSAEPGSGVAYDHEVLSGIERRADKLFILAGGMKPSNVASAIADVKPDAVDVSSGVEYTDRPGKNPKLIDEFVDAVFHRI